MRRHAKALLVVLVATLTLGFGASAALAAEPTLSVDPVAEHSIVTAKVTGKVTFDEEANGGAEGYWYFQYCENASPGECTAASSWSYGPEAFSHTLPAGTADEPVEETLTGLKAGTEYSVRLAAMPFTTFAEVFSEENPGGGYESFTTDPATPPVLALDSAGSVSLASAQLSGTIDPEGGNEDAVAGLLPISWELQYAPLSDPEGWQSAGSTTENPLTGSSAEASTPVTVEANATGLAASTAYRTRLVAHYAGLTATLPEGEYGEFTTGAASNAPTLAVESASALTRTRAQIAATLDPNGGNVDAQTGPLPIHWELQYTRASEPGAWQTGEDGTIEGSQAGSSGPIALAADLTGLAPGTEYFYRLSVTYGGEEEASSAGSFETLSSAGPDIATGAARHVASTSAYLRGTVNPNEESTVYWFEYGTGNCATSSCTAVPVPKIAAGSGDGPAPASFGLGGLSPSTTYHFRLLAENSSGVAAGGDETFTTAPTPGGCANEARRVEQDSTYLPECRAYELTTPGTGSDIMLDSGRTVAAADEAPGLPMAVKFSSLAGMGDVSGGGIAFDYLSQRKGGAETSGWEFHGITPQQGGASYHANSSASDPVYELFSPDLTQGVFRSLTSLPGTSENAKEVPNLYRRDDVRGAGAGSYQLLTDSASPQAPLLEGRGFRPWIAGTSSDMRHVLFESQLNLTADATGPNTKLYKSDDGVIRLVTAHGSCAGPSAASSVFPCSRAGLGSSRLSTGAARYTPHVISDDGSRVNFMTPFGADWTTVPNSSPGLVSRLYQLDDRGTAATDDDALIQLSMSENPSPEAAQAAVYQTASADGERVFFTSGEQLTAAPGSGLYMWERQEENETQELAVDAAGGDFTLTAHSQPSYGSGTLTENSTEVTGVTGSFTVGQAISAPGIPVGTTVAQVATSGETIFLSAEATENVTAALTASFEQTTGPLAWDATAADVQSALEGLSQIGTGNVSISGGPAGTAPLEVTFTGGLAGVDVMQLTADGGGLTGGAATASVHTTSGVKNLSLIGKDASALIGASEDGHRAYFSRIGANDEIWYWQDADGAPGGALSHVATIAQNDLRFQIPSQVFWNENPVDSRVTPDGRALLFMATDGTGLPPHYQHGMCLVGSTGANNGHCNELYLYLADSSTPTEPDIACVSCDFSTPGVVGNKFLSIREATGAATSASNLSSALTDDGSRVLFHSEAALVPQDTNRVMDVYEYDLERGTPSLISSGADLGPSYLLDASADGSDVFFATREGLSGWDDDQTYDLYDARVGGGFHEPPPSSASCSGADDCRGRVAASPPSPANGSGSISGPGNPQRACPKGKRRARKGGRARCVSRKSRKHRQAKRRRAASDNRRAGK